MKMHLYDILGVSKTATSSEIKKAYKSLVKKYHPDVFEGNKDLAESKIKEINDAYDTLSDPVLREEYDRSLEVPETDDVLKNSAYDDTSESEVQKRYNDFRDRYENVYKYGKSGRYTTNYYGVSHDPSKANTWDYEKNRPLRDSDFLFGSRSAFIIRMSLIILLILILLILWLSFMKKYMDNNYVHVPVVEKPAYQNDDLPLIDFDMAYEDVVILLGDPDPIQYKGSNLYAYWGSSYIIFDKNFKVIGWLNNGAFHTDEYTGAASKHLRELYNSINSSYNY